MTGFRILSFDTSRVLSFGEIWTPQNQFLESEWNPDCCYVEAVPVPCPNCYNGQISITRLGCFYVTAILSWGWVDVDIEAEVDLNLRLKWGWDEIESKFSLNWVEVELSWSWDKLTLNKGRNWAFIGVGLWFKICLRQNNICFLCCY